MVQHSLSMELSHYSSEIRKTSDIYNVVGVDSSSALSAMRETTEEIAKLLVFLSLRLQTIWRNDRKIIEHRL